MHLYALTLQKAGVITSAIFGNFSAPKAQEIVVARGKILELLRPDDDTGKVQSILQFEVFGVIRCMLPFRLVGGNRDFIVIGSDSGRINIIEYDTERNRFIKVHEETFGKSGCRRIVPGQYLATDPKGRAVMIGAIEKTKLVYVLNRDSNAKLTISSPLEANKQHTLCYDMCGVDVGFENPVFACIEVDYEEKDDNYNYKNPKPHKFLTFYELDLGLNHVTRKWTHSIDDGANICLTVPGGSEGPGGVLVCAENCIIWTNHDCETVRAPIPRRYGIPDDKGVLIVATATHTQRNLFFFLMQSEYGDIYKVTLTYDEDVVEDLHVKYFDTIPPCNSLSVLKTGFLFCASEFGNHYLFQFQGIGDDDDTPSTSAKNTGDDFVYFQPRQPTNLALIDEMESLCPIMDMKVADLAKEHTPQIYTICGRGPRSTLRILRHGLAVTEMAVSELPGNPNAVWAVKASESDEYNKYIIVSFVNATIVLAIGETVVEVNDSGILDSTETLSLTLLGENSLLQIHPNGIRHIRENKRIHEWKTPGKKTIVQSACNSRQVVIGLSGGELVYFELDNTGTLMDVHRKEMRNDIACLAIGPIPHDRQRSLFMVVGSFDNTVRVLSLDPSQPMHQLTIQALPAQPQSLCLLSMVGASVDEHVPSLYLYVGLSNGVMIRSILDESDGSLADARKRFLGTRGVKLFEIKVQGNPAVMALSSRSWLSHTYQNRFHMTPLSYDVLEYASSFSSEQCPEGIVCISVNTLRIVTLEKLGELFNQQIVPLRYTPRQLLIHPVSNNLIILETDHNSYSYKVKKELQATLTMDDDEDEDDDEDDDAVMDGEPPKKKKRTEAEGKEGDAKKGDKTEEQKKKEEAEERERQAEKDRIKQIKEEEDEKDREKEGPSEAFIGTPQAGPGKWASCIRIVDPVEGETISLLELEDNEACFSMCTVRFKKKAKDQNKDKDDGLTELYLVVGTIKDFELTPPRLSAAFIRLYRFINDHTQIQLVHKTEVSDPVLAVHEFQNRLLVGVGNMLRIYDLGKRKLLRKCENKKVPSTIRHINVLGDRIYISDMCESFFLAKYNKQEKILEIFADTTSPRYLTASCVVDYDTVAAGDKFGNIFVARLPEGVTESIEKDPSGGKARLVGKYNQILNGAPHKLLDIVQFHVGEIPTAITKTSLVPGGAEVLFFATNMGSLGILVPFTSREDLDFFTHLEIHLRQENMSLTGRDHLAYRSYYFPNKECIDGDLAEQFSSIDYERQQAIAEELVCTPSEVNKKLEEIRNRVL